MSVPPSDSGSPQAPESNARCHKARTSSTQKRSIRPGPQETAATPCPVVWRFTPSTVAEGFRRRLARRIAPARDPCRGLADAKRGAGEKPASERRPGCHLGLSAESGESGLVSLAIEVREARSDDGCVQEIHRGHLDLVGSVLRARLRGAAA